MARTTEIDRFRTVWDQEARLTIRLLEAYKPGRKLVMRGGSAMFFRGLPGLCSAAAFAI